MSHGQYRLLAKKLHDGDPKAKAVVKALAAKAGSDPHAAHALKCIAKHYKDMYGSSMIAGALPAAASVVGKGVKLVLAPVAWAAGTVGTGVHWVGSQLKHLAHAL